VPDRPVADWGRSATFGRSEVDPAGLITAIGTTLGTGIATLPESSIKFRSPGTTPPGEQHIGAATYDFVAHTSARLADLSIRP
jgi:hypothetical protein